MSTVSQTYGINPPKPWTSFKMTEECANPGLIVGIEVEVEGVRHGLDEMRQWCKPLGIEIKQDGSLRATAGGAPWEYITKPTQIQHVLPILREFFRKMDFGPQNFSDRTSIHVHANCADLEWTVLANISLLYTVFEEILFEFVNNKPGSRDGYSRDTNLYCVPWNQCRDHYNVVRDFISNPDAVLGRWQKYTALNLQPLSRQNTVEFRHMHGTADVDKLKIWLNVIGSIFTYAQRSKHEDLVKEIVEMNTVSAYEAYFNNVLGRSLPYNYGYRRQLEEGLIFAKYSLMSSRPKAKKKAEAALNATPVAPAGIPGGPAPVNGNIAWGNPFNIDAARIFAEDRRLAEDQAALQVMLDQVRRNQPAAGVNPEPIRRVAAARQGGRPMPVRVPPVPAPNWDAPMFDEINEEGEF